MNRNSTCRCSLATVALGLGLLGSMAAGQAAAGCASYSPGVVPPAGWGISSNKPVDEKSQDIAFLVPVAYREDRGFMRVGDDGGQRGGNFGGPGNADIVGLWKFTWILDGSPPGVVFDFGTVIWHADGTEVTISGGRPPSTGDVCMGVWKQTGPNTYKLNHLAFAWTSADTPPEAGPPSAPARFLGQATMTQTVTLSRSGNAFEGRFALDQHVPEPGTTIHFEGKVVATRMRVE